MPKQELTDIEVKVHLKIEKAIRVSLDGDPANAVWLPLSKIEIEDKPNDHAIITLPVWLAQEKELI